MTELPPHPPGAAERKLSQAALWGLILGILSFFLWFLAGIPGLILSIVGLVKTGKPNSPATGKGLAIGGIVTSSLGILIVGPVLIFAALSIPTYTKIRHQAYDARTLSSARQLVLACRVYAVENDGEFPRKLDQLFPDYLDDGSSLQYREAPSEPPVNWVYFPGLTDTDDPEMILIATGKRAGDNRIVGRIGGTVETVSEIEFQAEQAKELQ